MPLSAVENRVAEALGFGHAHIVGRGTTALWAALRALSSERSEVLVPACACEVVAAAVKYAGRTLRYVDVDPNSGNITTATLERAWRPESRLLIAIHNYGTPLAIDEIANWARGRGVTLLEDCCNSLGATWKDRPVGTWGAAAVYSFGYEKILDVGGGGVVASNDGPLVQQCRRLCAAWRPLGESQRRRDGAFQACLRVVRQHRELRDPALIEMLYQRYLPALLVTATDELAITLASGLPTLSAVLKLRRSRAAQCRAQLQDPWVRHRREVAGDACWRYTCHVPGEVRDTVVARVRRQNVPISTWFSVLQRFFPTRQSPAELAGAYAFEKTVINLFLSPRTDDATLEASLDALRAALEDVRREQEAKRHADRDSAAGLPAVAGLL